MSVVASTAEETEYCAEESSDRAEHAEDDRGNGIQHRYDRVRGCARRDHDNARCCRAPIKNVPQRRLTFEPGIAGLRFLF